MAKKDFFYSPNGANAFWVFGYWQYQQTLSVKGQCDALMKAAQEFAEMANCKVDDVHSFVVDGSQRYQHMMVFYCQTMIAPKDAYSIGGNGWNMMKWLHY